MGRRPKPPCEHGHCEILDLGRCIDDDPITTTPDELKELRLGAELTQEEAARLVGGSGGRLWRKWEKGAQGFSEGIPHLFALLTEQAYPVGGPR